MSTPFFLTGILPLFLLFYLILVVSLLLVLVSLERLPSRLFPGLIGLQFLHELARRRGRFMNGPPDGFRFVHEGIAERHLHFSLDTGVGNALAILLRQLEYLVAEALFGGLVPLQLLDVAAVGEEFAEDVRAAPDVVNVGWELRLALVEQMESLDFGLSVSG